MTLTQDTANQEVNDLSLERYQRQIMVSQLGIMGQQKLADSHVAIIGMGGLGSPASLYLVGAGVGKITLIDHDTVSLTNLHRQILYHEEDIGKLKADVAMHTLTQMNSDIEIVSSSERLSADNIDSLLLDMDVVVDAADNFALSYLLSDYCLQQAKPLISASVMGVTGYVGIYCHSTDPNRPVCPSLRAVFPHPPPAGQDCNSVGVVGTASGMMGLMQAQEVIKVILGDDEQLAGRLLSMDLWTYRQTIIDFNGAKEPDSRVDIISGHSRHADDWVIDVRRLDEVIAQPKFCHQHQPVSELMAAQSDVQFSQLPKHKRLVFICASGTRALIVADKALQAGFDKVAVWL